MNYSHIMRTRGTSYFLASILFPRSIKSEVMTLYAFVRFFDDIVDHPSTDDTKDEILIIWYRKEADEAREGKRWTIQIIYERMQLARQKGIQKNWIDAFLDAMQTDTRKKNYQTYEELKEYMYGSAEVIGLMMLKIIGYNTTHEDETIIWAKKLAEAMQYTNFLRDIKEDWNIYGRIYIPEEELKKYGLTQTDIQTFCTHEGNLPNQWGTFMKAQIARTRILYKEAETTIVHLEEEGELPVLMASHMYEAILDKIESKEYKVFATSNTTTLQEKTKVFVTTLRKKIPLRHRSIWITITWLFILSIIGYILNIDTSIRELPGITTAIFVIATLPIIVSGKNRWKKILFIAGMRCIEWIGHTTHIPFGEYTYQLPWTTRGILNIPIFIACSRLLIISIASNITKSRRWTIIMVVVLDIILEPFATLMNYRTWTWSHILTAPWTNYLSWWIITAIVYRIVRKRKISRLRSLLMYLTIAGYSLAVVLLK